MADWIKFAQSAREKLSAHGSDPPRVLIHKGRTYLRSLATAPFYLRGATSVGRRVRCDGRPRIENFGTLHIEDDVILRSVCVAVELATDSRAQLRVGKESFLNYGVSIGATQEIDIGERVYMGPYVMVVDSGYHDIYNRTVRPPSQPVSIGNDVWIGAKASVLPGVTIGEGAVIGASSVVTSDVPPFTVAAGVPCRIVRELDPEKVVRASVASPGVDRDDDETFASLVNSDYEVLQRNRAKYQQDLLERGQFPSQVVQKVGLQMAVAIRVMQALRDSQIPLAPEVMSRIIRHLYGADIHSDAQIGSGLYIIHGNGVVVSKNARIGKDCVIFHNATVSDGPSAEGDEVGAPTLGDNVHVGPGAVLMGPITVGEGTKILAGSVVTRSVPPYSVVRPAPQKVVTRKKKARKAN